MRLLILSFIFISTFLLVNQTSAQSHYRFTRHWNVSAYIGTSNFHGDVSDNTNSFRNSNPFSKYFYQDRRFGGGIYIDKMFNPYLGIRGSLLYTSMKSTKETEKIYFTGNLYSYTLSMVIDISNIFLGVDKRRPHQVYGFIGIGLSETRSELYNLLNDSLLQTVGYHVADEKAGEERLTELTIPVGIGYRYKFAKQFSVFGEITRQVVLSNKIDAYPIEGTMYESVGLINVGVTYYFRLPNHWTASRSTKYNGKSSDPSIRQFNKKKRVVMKTKANKRARKMRRNYGFKKKRFKLFR